MSSAVVGRTRSTMELDPKIDESVEIIPKSYDKNLEIRHDVKLVRNSFSRRTVSILHPPPAGKQWDILHQPGTVIPKIA